MSTPSDPSESGSIQPPHGQPSYGQPSTGQPGYGYVDPLYGSQPAFPFAPLPPKHPSATTSMILGVVGLASLSLCGIGLVLSPFAWIMGARAVKEIDAEPTRWSGRSEANSGKIIGIIGTVLLAVVVVGIIAFIALVTTTAPTTTSTGTNV